ncbi:MAG TPA: S24 family peptidase [Variovorax sp.]|nr:S24 family peptidase [Variovorax sp.]
MTLSERIREAMDASGKSAAELARATNKTAGSVSQWLDGTIKSIKADTAAALESATGFRSTWLATGKGPKLVSEMPTTSLTGVNPVEHAGRPTRNRQVPVVGTARMGEDGFYDEISSVPGGGDGHIEITTEDPDAYCLRLRGQSMFPAIRDGWYVLIEPNGEPQEGEYVLIKLRDGRRMVKELMYRRKLSIEVMSVNGGERLSFDYSDLDERGMQPVVAVVSPSKWRPD